MRVHLYPGLVIVFVSISFVSVTFYRLANSDVPWRKWSNPKAIDASSSFRNTTDFGYSKFQIDVEHTNWTETGRPEKSKVPPGVVSLEPLHLVRVVYGSETWLVECRSGIKETTVVVPSIDFCRR